MRDVTPQVWAVIDGVVNAVCVIVALVVGWVLGRAGRAEPVATARPQRRAAAPAPAPAAVPFDQEAPPRRRVHRAGSK